MADKADLIKTLKGLFSKSIPADVDVADVLDLWNEADGQHSIPSEDKVKTGPSESSDGEGAFKMIGQYSTPAPQTEAVANYEKFSKYLEGMSKAMKAQNAQIQALAAVLLKSEEAAPVVTETFLTKAESRLKIAKTALRKADMADEDEKEDKEESFEKAERALASAKKLIAKAEKENEDEDKDDVAEGVEKALSELKKLSKALIKAQAEMPAAVEVVAPVVVKAEEDKKEVEKEVEKSSPDRLTILETTVEGMIKTIQGQGNISKSAPLPDLMKAVQIESVGDRIEAAMDDGSMNDIEIIKAKDILSRFQAARNGQYDGVKLHEEIDAAPEKVRELFKAAA